MQVNFFPLNFGRIYRKNVVCQKTMNVAIFASHIILPTFVSYQVVKVNDFTETCGTDGLMGA